MLVDAKYYSSFFCVCVRVNGSRSTFWKKSLPLLSFEISSMLRSPGSPAFSGLELEL